MAFWGLEVKPGKPVTHSLDRERGRLRISQATLGFGSSTVRSLVQCNIGKKSPVLLCALLPDKTESCHLDLEFEEDDEVLFSVLGPRSVHLTGYFVGNRRHSTLSDNSESYGEDIASTDTEKSAHCSDEDKYEGSFIDDDDDPDIFSPSPVSSAGVDEEMLDQKPSKERKGIKKQLKKKYQISESEDDCTLPKQNTGYDSGSHAENEDEDNFTLSVLKSKRSANSEIPRAEGDADKLAVKTNNKKTEDDGIGINESQEKTGCLFSNGQSESKGDLPSLSLLLPDQVVPEVGTGKMKERQLLEDGTTTEDEIVSHGKCLKKAEAQQDDTKAKPLSLACDGKNQMLDIDNAFCPENGIKSNKKRKKRSKTIKNHEANSQHGKDTKDAELKLALEGTEIVVKDVLASNEHDTKPTTYMEIDVQQNTWLPSEKEDTENGPNPKKRKKECKVDKKFAGSNVDNSNSVLEEGLSRQDVKTGNMVMDLPVAIDDDQNTKGDRSLGTYYGQFSEGGQSDGKKSRKKKKKSNYEENKADTGLPAVLKEEKKISSLKLQSIRADPVSSQVRTLSNGLVIEELKRGEPDGKIATPGRKVKVYYTGKFKESGKIFNSNVDKAPYKFRLGDENIIMGWNAGLEGMRVGDKRRLIIPPSLSYGSPGAGENVPPNSWLVYDVELAAVHR